MKLQRFVTPDLTVVPVFARDHAHAVGVYAAWFEARHAAFPSELCIALWRPTGERSSAHLEAALSQCVTGVGYYHSETGWTIKPADELQPFETER